MKRLLVTGIGRSGTGYMAKLLTDAGIPCGHEAIYDSGTHEPPDWGDAVAESSWFSAPMLNSVRRGTFVLHVVRHPMNWLASWAFTVWRPERRSAAPTQYISRHLGEDWCARAEADPIDAAMALWVAWNRMIEADPCPTLRMKVDHMDHQEERLEAAFRHMGVQTNELRKLLRKVPRNVNSRPHEGLTWKQVKDKPSAARFRAKAERYGYEIGITEHQLNQEGRS